MEGLSYDSSEHVVSRGTRVELTDTCRLELIGAFGASYKNGEEFPLDRCVVCNRGPITKGDFALEHQAWVRKDGETTKVERVRTFPRLWCFSCSIENAKAQRVPRASNTPIKPLADHWLKIARQLAEHGSDASIASEPLPNADANPKESASESISAIYIPTDAELVAKVGKLQVEQPELGMKRITSILHEGGWNVSAKRVKAHMTQVFEYGALCRVGEVFPLSPAARAGLEPGDMIVGLGGKTGRGYIDVRTSIVPLIEEGVAIEAIVRRKPGEAGPLRLELVPGKWEGGGLLGCVLHEVAC